MAAAGREFVAGEDYSIADMAIYPWVPRLEREQKGLDRLPNLKRGFDAIGARPATIGAYRRGKAINQAPTMTEESKTPVRPGRGQARGLGPGYDPFSNRVCVNNPGR